jgi:hypothetical protein
LTKFKLLQENIVDKKIIKTFEKIIPILDEDYQDSITFKNVVNNIKL